LPEETRFLQYASYTGRYGSKENNARIVETGSKSITFETTAPLMPGEGFTVAVAWPTGLVKRPDSLEKLFIILADNLAALAGLIGVGLLLAYYLSAWRKVGKDPEPGTIIPLFEPPERLSPAAARYISNMAFDDKAFSVALVSLAVKGFLRISESGRKEYTVVKTGAKTDRAPAAELSKGEQALYAALFASGDMLALKRKNHSVLSSAAKALKKALAGEYKNAMFRSNIAWVVVGALLTIVAIVLVLALSGISSQAIFAIAPLTPWLVIMLARGSSGGGKASRIILAIALVFVLGFGLVGGSAINGLGGRDTFTVLAVVAALVALNVMFYYWLKAPTRLGRRFLDKLDGFKLFLGVAEKDRLNTLHPPEKTPELFEKYLPWALALDVDQQWMAQFSDVLAAASAEQTGGYQPVWYSGRSFNDFGRRGFASSLSSGLTSAIASASTAPGTSSGFSSGGGFSGGGGGGGGGGGW